MACFAVLGSAHLQITGRIGSQTVSRVRRGEVRTSFGGTGLNLSVTLASQGHKVEFATAVPDRHINLMILEALRAAGVGVHAEFDLLLPEAGESHHYMPNGEVWSGVIATPIERVMFRDKQIANVVDPADEVIVEATLHPRTIEAVIRRAGLQNKRVWIAGASEHAVPHVLPVLANGVSAAGVFVKDGELGTMIREAGRTKGLGRMAPSPAGLAAGIGGFVVHTKNQVGSCTLWAPGRSEPVCDVAIDRVNLTGASSWPDAADHFMACTLSLIATDHLPLIDAVGRSVARVQQDLVDRSRSAYSDPLEARLAALTHDALTGLGNRHNLGTWLRRFDDENQMALLMIDLDHFKRINDTFGHDTGDVVLATVGKILKSSVRHQDRPFRVGGEEMMVLMPDTPIESAKEVGERIRQAIEGHPFGHGRVTSSIGVAAGLVSQVDGMRERADQALYVAKQSGRNRVVVAKEADEHVEADEPSAAPAATAADGEPRGQLVLPLVSDA